MEVLFYFIVGALGFVVGYSIIMLLRLNKQLKELQELRDQLNITGIIKKLR